MDARLELKRPTAHAMRSQVIETLHAMIHERLFGSRPWLADHEVCYALTKTIRALGLKEPVAGEPGTERWTAFGCELKLDLMQTFMGFWDEYEIPFILAYYDLISEDEMDEAEQRLEKEDAEAVLLPMVRSAFIQHFQAARG